MSVMKNRQLPGATACEPAPAGARRDGPRVRTSASDPLRIDEVPAGLSGGLIGITFCPGKCGHSLAGASWQRDLGTDLDVIARWRAAAVVTLIEDHEFDMLGVTQLGSQVQARGIAWHHMPIVDVRPPDARFEAAWRTNGPNLLAILRGGARVLVHCRGGLGRAGTVAARLLVELGVSPSQAIERVRQARPRAIETAEQEDYVLKLPRGSEV